MQYELKTMSLGEILDMSFRLFRDNFWLLYAITGIVYFPLSFAQGLIQPPTPADPRPELSHLMLPLIAFVIGALVVLLFGPIANAAVTKVVAEQYLDRPTSFRSAYGYVFRRIGKLIGALLLSSLIIGVGFLLLIIPGIIFALRYALVPVVVIVEDKGGMDALRRSQQLMKGNGLKLIVLWLLVGVLSSMMGSLTGLIPQHLLMALVSAGAGILYTAFAQIVYVVLYMHARCEKEAFDLEFLAKSLSDLSPRTLESNAF